MINLNEALNKIIDNIPLMGKELVFICEGSSRVIADKLYSTLDLDVLPFNYRAING